MSFRRVLIPDSVVVVIYDDEAIAPSQQEERLERALQREFPAGTSASLVVDLGWSDTERAWHLRRAITTLNDVRVSVVGVLGRGLFAAGIPIVGMRTMRSAEERVRTRGTPRGTGTGGTAEARRTPRVVRSVRLRLESENGAVCNATSAVINAHGALLLSPEALPNESRVRITNMERGLSWPFRVVWCGEPTGDVYKLGVEMLTEGVDFWGPSYRPETGD